MEKEIIQQLRNAIKQDDINTVKNIILSNEDWMDIETPAGSFLHDAAMSGMYDVVKYLVEKGIDISVTYYIGNIEKCDAYEYARQYGQTEIADYLKKNSD